MARRSAVVIINVARRSAVVIINVARRSAVVISGSDIIIGNEQDYIWIGRPLDRDNNDLKTDIDLWF